MKDFAPISLAASTPNILVVHPLLPVKSVRELINLLAPERCADEIKNFTGSRTSGLRR